MSPQHYIPEDLNRPGEGIIGDLQSLCARYGILLIACPTVEGKYGGMVLEVVANPSEDLLKEIRDDTRRGKSPGEGDDGGGDTPQDG